MVRSANQRSTRLTHDALVGVEVQYESGMSCQPAFHGRCLVGGDVIENEVQFQVSGHLGVDGFQERQELGGPMS